MKVKFERNYANVVWDREYYITLENDMYAGWICRYRKNQKWNIYSSDLGINEEDFPTLNDAKAYVRKQAEKIYG